MTEENTTPNEDLGAGDERRVYEVGYHILSTVKEDEVENVVSEIRSAIEGAGGTFISEGAPQSIALAYTMYVNDGGKNTGYDRAYFGWIKFETTGEGAVALQEMLGAHKQVLRSIVFKTVREDTRAEIKPAKLREVKRTDTIAKAPKKSAEEESAEKGEVSEKELDKALEEITEE